MSRDKLVGLLWPDSDAERARHSLTQALYAARRALRTDDLFLAGADIRLTPGRLESDVGDLERALAAGNLEQAVELYRGPFLDGFHLSGSAEFERWATSQRDRVEQQVVLALESLASRADTVGDPARAAQWRRRLVALRPLDSAATVRLMTSLAQSGDRAGALQHARIHEALLREQLDLEPDPAIGALVARLREGPEAVLERGDADGAESTSAPAVASAASPPAPAEYQPAVTASGVPRMAEAQAPAQIGVWVPTPRARRRGPLIVLLTAVVALVALGVVLGRRSGTPPPLEELALRQRVVVAPFRVAGADPSLAYLRDGLVELLSTRLADDSAARSVDAGAVLGAWRQAGLSVTVDVPRETVVRLADRLGAERVVIGSVVGTPARVIVRASVLSVPSGAQSAEATVAGSADSLTTLVDRLAAQLLAAEAGEEGRLASITTTSLPALRAYLAGQAAFRRADFASAIQHFERALRRDPRFGLAAMQIAISADRDLDAEQVRRGVALAWPSREALSERDSALLLAYAGPRYPAPSARAEQVAAWQRLVDLDPRGADSWYALGARLAHDGALAGIGDAGMRAASAFERAIGWDAGHVPSHDFLGLLVSPLEEAESPSRLAHALRWRAAAIRADSATLRAVRDTMLFVGPVNLRTIAMVSQFDGLAIDDGLRALEIMEARATDAASRASALLASQSMASLRGRPAEAAAIVSRLERQQRGSHAALRLRVLDALYGDGDSARAAVAARDLASLVGDGGSVVPSATEVWMADACVLAQWLLATGDVARARPLVAGLRRDPGVHPSVPVAADPIACAAVLETSIAVLERHPEARERLRQLDSLVLTPQVAGDLATYAPLVVARLHLAQGDEAAALRALRRQPYLSGWPRYRASMLREAGRLAERAGDSARALEAYRMYLALRSSPERSLETEVAEVREAARKLESG